MRDTHTVAVIIPAHNEEQALGLVIQHIPSWVDDIIVADNGSTDNTATVARTNGAQVATENQYGYGAACLAGIAALPKTDIVVFLDGDYSDFPQDMADVVDPIVSGDYDFVVGSRALGEVESGALTPQQQYGNWLATTLMRLLWGARYTDLGPFRAISFAALKQLNMSDKDFGWTVEMQIKAARQNLKYCEVPVRYRQRIGVSKISGTITGTLKAGTKILTVIARHALKGSTSTKR